MSVEILGVEATIAAIGSAVEEFDQEVDALIQKAGQEGEQIATSLAAVRTGLMKSNIAYIPGQMESYTISPIYYSIFVDQGTVKMAAQPFATPAYDIASENLKLGIQAL